VWELKRHLVRRSRFPSNKFHCSLESRHFSCPRELLWLDNFITKELIGASDGSRQRLALLKLVLTPCTRFTGRTSFLNIARLQEGSAGPLVSCRKWSAAETTQPSHVNQPKAILALYHSRTSSSYSQTPPLCPIHRASWTHLRVVSQVVVLCSIILNPTVSFFMRIFTSGMLIFSNNLESFVGYNRTPTRTMDSPFKGSQAWFFCWLILGLLVYKASGEDSFGIRPATTAAPSLEHVHQALKRESIALTLNPDTCNEAVCSGFLLLDGYYCTQYLGHWATCCSRWAFQAATSSLQLLMFQITVIRFAHL
jgi:hypothetical protein